MGNGNGWGSSLPWRAYAIRPYTFSLNDWGNGGCGLFPGDEVLHLVEDVEGFEWGEAVDVGVEDAVAYLSEHRVVELEETELHAFAALADLDGGLGDAVVAVAVFELLKDDLGALDDAGLHAFTDTL